MKNPIKTSERLEIRMKRFGDFPGGPEVKTLPSKVGGAGLIPSLGTKIPHAS